MALAANYAQRAIAYTQRVLGVTPSNHFAERIRTLGGSTQCVADIRSVYGPNIDNERIMNIRRIAGAAKRRHCGNCGEYAAVAFDYLMLTHCPFAIEYASYVSPGDHAFVIIHRPVSAVVSEPRSWGHETVIADAWAGKVVRSLNYWTGMPQYPSAVHAPAVGVRYHAQGDFPVPSSQSARA